MRRRKLIAAVATILLAVASAGAWSLIRKRAKNVRRPIPQPIAAVHPAQGKSSQARPRVRNLSLQPEAFTMAEGLGRRFAAQSREKSVLVGTLTIGTDRRNVQITRNQTDDGEQIEIRIAGSGQPLTWDANEGVLSTGRQVAASDRDMVERLVFDSPDQFVLAQLRGASYFTVARNVRPANAVDNYRGPLWNIVRVNDPQNDQSKAPQSRWRLYYVNAGTGVIERIESQSNGSRMVAELSAWVEQNGERFPTQIVWKQQNQNVMQYNVTSFSHADK